ncbi:MAG: EAL domain-containing protein [Chloroflexota bacterium]
MLLSLGALLMAAAATMLSTSIAAELIAAGRARDYLTSFAEQRARLASDQGLRRAEVVPVTDPAEPTRLPRYFDPVAARGDLTLRPTSVLRASLLATDGTIVYRDPASPITPLQPATLEAARSAMQRGETIAVLDEASPSTIYAVIRGQERGLSVLTPVVVDGRSIAVYWLELGPTFASVVRSPLIPYHLAGLVAIGLIVAAALVWVLSESRVQARVKVTLLEEELAAQRWLAKSREERLSAFMGNSADIVTILSPDAEVRYQSPLAEQTWGPQPSGSGGILSRLHPEDLNAVGVLLRQVAAKPGAQFSTEVRLKHLDNSWHVFDLTAKNLVHDRHIDGILATWRDCTERKLFEEQLRELAYHDTLTALPNRALFMDRLQAALARSGGRRRPIGVLFLDLDNFKTINDGLGHDAGDRLLRDVAHRLRRIMRPGDTVARFGGDEFTVLLEDIDGEAAASEMADRIATALRPPTTIDGHEVFPAFSIGIAVSSPEVATAESLLRNADSAMYHAKANGKARAELFDASMVEVNVDRLELEADLRHAIERDELRVLYQPIVSLESGRVLEAEALVRWQHPRHGLVSPGRFIPIAEETGLVVPIGNWVLEEACRQTHIWNTRYGGERAITVGVNLAARQLMQPDLVTQVADVLLRTGLEPARLKLEITESVLVQDTAAAIERMMGLKWLGVQLAIDDFGTGYSSLAYLKQFPVDTLKIDRAFVSGLGRDANDSAIVQSVISLGRALGLSITGEGIETPRQIEALRELGCDRGQGFYFARPQLDEVVGQMISRGTTKIDVLTPSASVSPDLWSETRAEPRIGNARQSPAA